MLELNVRFVPVFAGKLPPAPVTKTTLHVVSDDSSATPMFVVLVALVALSALPVTSPERLPANVVAVTTPV